MTPNKWAVFAIVAVGVSMATLDSSIVNIRLPAIGRSFGTALSGSRDALPVDRRWSGNRNGAPSGAPFRQIVVPLYVR